MPDRDPPDQDQQGDSTHTEGPTPNLTLRSVGPYALIKELGHGGMGTVYLAERADGLYKKRVAIKVIRGQDSEEVIRRFRRERRILSALDHPYIAKLLDGGTTDEGLPYLVMEYVEGEPIDAFCDHRRLPTAARIQLFRSVCSAVQHAHRNLVVHRDLKPGNILVSADGLVKLLDFGIAKLLNPELLGEGGSATQVALTPEYASPEQARGEPITTATDVYSLGVVLYELLTGRRPYRPKSQNTLEVLRAVVDDDPERPSTAVGRTGEGTATPAARPATVTPETLSRLRDATPERLSRELRGDLDNIVLMALRKEQQKRYSSAEALSEDLARYLEGRPVLARKGTAAYRVGKFVKRHVIAVTSGAAALLFVVAFAVTVSVQASRLKAALERADHERAKAEKVSGLLVDLFKVADPSEARGNTITVREVLDKGAERLTGELKEQPELQAPLLDSLGRAYASLGLYDRALHLLRQGLEIQRRTAGGDSLEVASSLTSIGQASFEKGDFAAAETAHRQALALRRRLLGNEHPDVAISLVNLADALTYSTANYAEAEDHLREALAIGRRTLPDGDAQIASALSALGGLLWKKGDDGAEQLYREALAIRRKRLANDDSQITASLSNLALVLYEKGDLAAAEELFREVLARTRKLLGDEHPTVARRMHNLAVIVNLRGNAAEAEVLYRDALRILRRALGDENARVAVTAGGLADALTDQNRLGEAEHLYRQAVRTLRQVYPPGHPSTATTLIGLGTLLTKKGDAAGAEPLLREALSTRRRAISPGHPDIAEAESALGACLTVLHRYEEAEELLKQSSQVLEAKRGVANPLTRTALQRLAALYEASGRSDLARETRARGSSLTR